MKIISDIKYLRSTINQLKQTNSTIAFVPTMGNLHAGHTSLVEIAKKHADCVIVSIFVNPMQFGPSEDLNNYPRTFEDDCEKLKTLNVNVVFAPRERDLYPIGKDDHTQVRVPKITENYCGKSRPDFFPGIALVVTKFFNLVQPDVAIFGEKDYQQCCLIEKLIHDLNFPIKLITGPLVRESDGLALSSRNQYLSSSERKQATLLYKILEQTKKYILEGHDDFRSLEKSASKQLKEAGFNMDYFTIARRSDLTVANTQDKDLIILAAAYLGKTRLIDNVFVS